MTNQSVSGAFPTERSRLIVANAGMADRLKRPHSADLILIPKQLCVEWLDVIGTDPAVSGLGAKVAIIGGAHFNRYSGDTFVSQETVATILNKSGLPPPRESQKLTARTCLDAMSATRTNETLLARQQMAGRADMSPGLRRGRA